MVTLLSDYMGARTYDIEKGRIGYSPMHRDLFIEQLEECLTQSGAIMVRKCLTQKVTINTPKGPMRVPMKELYAARYRGRKKQMPLPANLLNESLQLCMALGQHHQGLFDVHVREKTML